MKFSERTIERLAVFVNLYNTRTMSWGMTTAYAAALSVDKSRACRIIIDLCKKGLIARKGYGNYHPTMAGMVIARKNKNNVDSNN